jgi:hypothetical protein
MKKLLLSLALVSVCALSACVSGTSDPEATPSPSGNPQNTSLVLAPTQAPVQPPHSFNANEIVEANDWIQTDGRFIYYRYASYLPDACKTGARRQTFATGNFNGWRISPVTCLPGGQWLAFDALATLRTSGTQLNTTYCINFRDGAGAWGAHGRPPLAPDLEKFFVPTPKRAVGGETRDWGQDGINPGFRISRTSTGVEVALASYRHRTERITITWLGPSGVTLEPQAPGDPAC